MLFNISRFEQSKRFFYFQIFDFFAVWEYTCRDRLFYICTFVMAETNTFEIDLPESDQSNTWDQVQDQAWEFSDLWIEKTVFEEAGTDERDALASDALDELTKSYVKKLIDQKKIPWSQGEKVSIKMNPNSTDTPEDVLRVLQKAKKQLDANKLEDFAMTMKQWTQGNKAIVLDSMYEQLWVNDADSFKSKVTEIKTNNEQYQRIDNYRDAIKMIRINKIRNKLEDYLKEDPKKAMNLMIRMTSIYGTWHIRQFSRMVDESIYIWSAARTNKRNIERTKKATQEMVDTYSDPFVDTRELFVRVANAYMWSMSIAHTFTEETFTK